MKFPKKLSRERISLLSPEDKKIYEYEHSGLCPKDNYNINDNINESNISNKNDNILEEDFDESTFYQLFDELYSEDIINEIGLNEYNYMKHNIYKYVQNNVKEEPHSLNEETTGIAADYWLKGLNLGWLGKLSAGLLTGLIGLLAWLFMKGKDRLALKKLKQYMNKIVELVDSGVNKKRPWYSFLIPSKKGKQNTGDYNKACFRTIQETAERNMACLYTKCIYNLGFLNHDRTDFNGITSGLLPEENSGLNNFKEIVSQLNGKIKEPYLEGTNIKLLPIVPDEELYQNINLPGLPTNYKMLMSNIDYPTKANTNPNGSLFMKPTLEILLAKSSDIGMAYFNNDVNLQTVINIKTRENAFEDYFIPYEYIQRALNEVEDEFTGLDKTTDFSGTNILSSDLAGGDIAGKGLEQETAKREETKVNTFKGNIVDAIDNYIRSSIPVVSALIRSVTGEQQSDLTSYLKTIITLNNAVETNMSDFMKKNDEVLKQIMDDYNKRELEATENKLTLSKDINFIISSLYNDDIVKSLGLNKDSVKKFIKKLTNTTERKKVNDLIQDLNIKDINNIDDLMDNIKSNNNNNNNTLNNSYSYIPREPYNLLKYQNSLFEDNQNQDNQEIREILNKNIFTTYNNVKNKLSSEIVGIIENDPSRWYIITNSRERMNALKEAANKEINAKIELICRVGSTLNSDLGDKFKAALSKHPVRAESLKGLWSKYSDDLTDRIESRIRSITGANGNSNILLTIKEFLLKTYPNLIALMLYYKEIYYFLKLYTEKYPIQMKSQKEIEQQEDIEITDLRTKIMTFKKD